MNAVCPQSRSGQLQPVSYIKQIKQTTAAIPLSHPPNPIIPPVSNAGDGEECGPGSHSAGLPEEELDPFDCLKHAYACLTELKNLGRYSCGSER